MTGKTPYPHRSGPIGNPSGLALATMALCAVFGLLGLVGVFALDGPGARLLYLTILAVAVGAIWREATQVLRRDDRLEIRRLLRVRRIPLADIRGWTLTRQGIVRQLYCPEILLQDGTTVRLDSLRTTGASSARSGARRVLPHFPEITTNTPTT